MGDIEEKRPDKEMEEEKEGEKEEQSQGKEKKTKREKRDREKRKKKRERSDKGKKKKKEEDDGEESEEEKIESLESEWGEERSEIDLYISDVLLKEMGWGGEGSIDATSEDAESRMSGGESERGGSERGGSERGGSERGGSEKGNSDRGSESGENGTREKRFNSAERFVGKDKGEGFSWVRTLKKKKERGPVVGSEWEIFLDFISMARSMARLIVLELFLPFEKKNIKPIADKEKDGTPIPLMQQTYLHKSIFFEFAVGKLNYSNSGYVAGKIAGRALRAQEWLTESDKLKEECVTPLTAVIDFRGFRVVASSYFSALKSLVFGYQPNSNTIKNDSESLSNAISQALTDLHLSPHPPPPTLSGFRLENSAKESSSSVKEKCFLLGGFEGVLPATPPKKGVDGGELFQCFRPEFLEGYGGGVMSGCAFRVDGEYAENLNQLEEESQKAFDHLLKATIPSLCDKLREEGGEENEGKEEGERVTELLHSLGVNMRYGGVVLSSFEGKSVGKAGPFLGKLLAELIARVIKNNLKFKFRQTAYVCSVYTEPFLEGCFRRAAIEYLNTIFGDGEQTEKWWTKELPSKLSHFFSVTWSPIQPHLLFSESSVTLTSLLERIGSLLKIRFSANAFTKVENHTSLEVMDILETSERAKMFTKITKGDKVLPEPTIIFFADGSALSFHFLKDVTAGGIVKHVSSLFPSSSQPQDFCLFELQTKMDLNATSQDQVSEFVKKNIREVKKILADSRPLSLLAKENNTSVLVFCPVSGTLNPKKERKILFGSAISKIMRERKGEDSDDGSFGPTKGSRRSMMELYSPDSDPTTSLFEAFAESDADFSEMEEMEGIRTNRLKDHLESTVLAANSKGRLYVAILGGSDLDKKNYYFTVQFEGKSYFTTNRTGPVTEWNEEFCFLVTDMESIVCVNFYQLGSKATKKKKGEDTFLDSYRVCVKDMVEGEMRREMMEIAWEKPSESKGSEGEKKRGLLYFHVVFEGDQTLAQYLPLEQLLMRDKFLVLDCLCNTVTVEDAAWMTSPLLSVLIWNGKIMPFFRRQLRKEVLATQSMDLLFRGQNLLIKTLSLFTFQTGQEYLISILQPFLAEIEAAEPFESGFEMDPKKMGPGETIDTNLPFLLKWASMLLRAVFDSVDKIPPPILHVCVYLNRAVIQVFARGIVNALSGFFFLRFLCPVLATPETLPGLRTHPPSTTMRRLLVLVAKIIQNVASLVDFGSKEEFMRPCNGFIQEMAPKMMKFYKRISSRNNLKVNAPIQRSPVQRNYYHLIHLAVVNYNILELLSPKKGDPIKGDLERELEKLGKPKQDLKAVELLGYVDLEKIAENIRNPEIGIASFGLHNDDQKGKGKDKKKAKVTFSSFDLIDWFCVNVPICHTRSDAVVLGNKLLEFQFIAPSSPSISAFTDADDLFELSDGVDTSSSGRIVLNSREQASSSSSSEKKTEEEEFSWTSDDPQDMVRFSRDLLETMGMLFSQASSLVEHEIKPVMLANIRDDPKFKVFTFSICKLQQMDPSLLPEQTDQIALWLNIYHTLMLHAYAERGAPPSSRALSKFLNSSCYNVGGEVVSLNEIEHAILRAPLPVPKSADRLPGGRIIRFSKKDPRKRLEITLPLPLLSFALSCGSKSSPDITVYTGSSLQSTLKKAATRFLTRNLSLRVEKDVLVVEVPKLLVWYSRDLGESKRAFLASLIPFIPSSHSKWTGEFMRVVNSEKGKKGVLKLKLEPKPFDFEFGCNLSILVSKSS